MDINNVLQMFSESDNDVYYINNAPNDFIVIEPQHGEFKLKIGNTDTNGVLLTFMFPNDEETMQDESSSLFVKNIEEIKPFLNMIFFIEQRQQFKHNNIIQDDENECSLVVESMKNALQDKPISSKFTLKEIETDSGYPSMELTNTCTNVKYYLDLSTNTLGELKNVYSLVSVLRLRIKVINEERVKKGQGTHSFGFNIPGYELQNYPIFDEFNKIQYPAKNVNEWVNQILNTPDVKRTSAHIHLEHFKLNNDLNNGNQNKTSRIKL